MWNVKETGTGKKCISLKTKWRWKRHSLEILSGWNDVCRGKKQMIQIRVYFQWFHLILETQFIDRQVKWENVESWISESFLDMCVHITNIIRKRVRWIIRWCSCNGRWKDEDNVIALYHFITNLLEWFCQVCSCSCLNFSIQTAHIF